MCLGTKLSDRSLQRYKAKGKKTGYIRIWKAVNKGNSRFCTQWKNFNDGRGYYETGLNVAAKDACSENALIHAFRDKASAELWNESESVRSVIVETFVKPGWVKAIGEGSRNKKALTTKATVMPEYPKRKVTVREFRAAIKGKTVKTYVWE